MHYARGRYSRQAHVDVPEGTVEEEYAREGFFGRYAHLYRTEPLVGWTHIEGELRPRALRAGALEHEPDYLDARIPLLRNADVTVRVARVSQPMPYVFRNADADEILFVHAGGGRLDTDFGPVRYERGDYVVLPRGTMYRLWPEETTRLLVLESAGEVGFPDRGILGQHALFDPEVVRAPDPQPPVEEDRSEWELRIQRQGRITKVLYPFNPLNTVGYKGTLTVWQLNVRDIRPVTSERYHLPPSAHSTFVAPNVVVCTFLPRALETGDPKAMRVPFYHSNIDYDEVLFYHEGDFFSREGIEAGMMTFHPQGLHHGPQPGAVAAAADKSRTDEVAVMIDTRNPLQLTESALAVDVPDYWRSWQGA
jgi:homogentisate 1,2-dioxygenase